jgi:catechol 2,3-dioxygenase-like lactoylglutathione lyase family enzyme
MNTSRLEHVNLTVRDPERTAAMLAELFGWHVRWKGPAKSGGHTVHVGGDDDYLAVYARVAEGADPDYDPGASSTLNHVGVVVDDLDAVEARVRARGLEPFNFGDYEPGRRFYFLDLDGLEWEVVSYA